MQYVLNTGYENHTCDVDEGDLRFCEQYAKRKPRPTCAEFFDLACLLMEENGWARPQDCQQALLLYMNLVDKICG